MKVSRLFLFNSHVNSGGGSSLLCDKSASHETEAMLTNDILSVRYVAMIETCTNRFVLFRRWHQFILAKLKKFPW